MALSKREFLEAYAPLQKAGGTAKEIAQAMKIPVDTFNQRIATLRRDIRLANSTLEVDGKEVNGEDYAREQKIDFAALQRAIVAGTIKVKVEGETFPTPANADRKRESVREIADDCLKLFK